MLFFRILGMAAYAAFGILILGFIFTNRHLVAIELFPFGATGEMPLYLVLCTLFALGLGIGLIHSSMVWLRMRARLRRSERAIAQLEKEIAARETTGQSQRTA